MTAAETALSKAKMKLMLGAGKFIASVAIQLEHLIDNRVSTAATNGIKVLYNEDFFMSLTQDEQVGLIAHECWHVAFMHGIRRGDRDPVVWNYAGDYVINGELHKDKLKLPEPHLYDAIYDNMDTEAIYDLLIVDQPEVENMMLDIMDGEPNQADGESPAMSPEEEKAIEAKVQEILVKAVTQAKLDNAAGSIPGEIARALDDLINPKLNWKELLERFVATTAKEDYAWKRPNKRFFPTHYLPSAYSEQLDHIAVAIDTSGSVSEQMMNEMLSEIKGIWDTYAPKRMTIMDCDYEIHNTYDIEDGEEILSLTFGGWGGTSFVPVLEYAKEHQPSVLLYFTDLYAEHFTEEEAGNRGYTSPIMWICYSDHEPQGFGETVYYEPNI